MSIFGKLFEPIKFPYDYGLYGSCRFARKTRIAMKAKIAKYLKQLKNPSINSMLYADDT